MASAKQAPQVRERQEAFSTQASRLYDIVQGMPDGAVKAQIIAYHEEAVSCIQALEVAADTPRYLNEYGPTYKQEHRTQVESAGSVIAHNTNINNRFAQHNELNITTQPGEWIYGLSPNLVIGTNGHFLFRPKDRTLHLGQHAVTMTELETKELCRVLSLDFGVRFLGGYL